MNAEARSSCGASTSRSTCAGRCMEYLDRDPADGRDRARGVVQGAARHHGRADLLARRARGRGAVRRDPPACARRASRSSSSATGSTSSMRSATASPSCATGAPCWSSRDGRHRQARARRGDARARPRDGARRIRPDFPRPTRRRATWCCRPKGCGSGARCGTLASRCATARSSASPACSARAAPRPRGRSSAPIRRTPGRSTMSGQAGLATGARRRDRARRRLLHRGPQGRRHRSRHVGAREPDARHPAAPDEHGHRR